MKAKLVIDEVIKDRPLILSWLVFSTLALILVILTALQVRPSELNIPSRYTSFGATHIYNDAWYYLIGFIVFAFVMVAAHSLIAMKLYSHKGIILARLFMLISIATAFIALMQLSSILEVAKLLQ